MSLVRNPALWTGLALIAVGGGNWLNGRMKLSEYETMIARPTQVAAASSPEEFPNLNERTTATLLEPLRTQLTTSTYAEGKRDFYRVVLTGGRLLALLGAFCVAAAAYWENRRQATAAT